jgi:drug/metabolite transporter (DMT)-like permease
MVALLGGTLAALSWGMSTLAASRAASAVGARVVLAWVMGIGLGLGVLITVTQPMPAIDGQALALLALAGFGNALGLLAAYTAFATGKVSIVAPIVSTQGAGAAAIAIALGEAVEPPVAFGLAVAAIGVVLVSWERTPPAPVGISRADAPVEQHPRSAVVLAAFAATLFAIGLYATGRIGAELGVGMTVLPSRTVGSMFVTLPLAFAGRLRLTRRVAPLVLLIGVLEVVGVVGVAIGSTDSISISVVLSSQFASVAAVGAFLLFHERITRHQLLGIGLIVTGVAAVAWLRAT